MYQFKIISIPGSDNNGADALSRIPCPTHKPTTARSDIEQSIIAHTQTSYDFENEPPAVSLRQIKDASLRDNQYQLLVYYIINGFPENKHNLDESFRPFWNLRHDICTVDSLVYLNQRVLIPDLLRKILVEQLHIGYQGVNSMRANARQRFFWPGMGSQLSLKRLQCKRCNAIAPSNHKEPMIQHTQPTHPFQMVVTDLFHMAGRTYIVYADRFSAWTEVASTDISANSRTICNIFRRYFTSFGVPEELTSDGGPPFQSAEFSSFLKKWDVQHRPSSAYYAQGNGRAEAAVKQMKRILTTNIGCDGSLDSDNVAKALLLHRNTPSSDIGASPAELLFGRPIRNHLPTPVDVRREWTELAKQREIAMRKRFISNVRGATPKKSLPTRDRRLRYSSEPTRQ